jgi:dCTP deaminase
MVPYYTRSGEYRVHYAGFFDPGFGWDPATKRARGSRAVLEVRSHEVPVILEHGKTVGWLRYDRMMDRPSRLYGTGEIKSNYQGQGLALAKHFKPWP